MKKYVLSLSIALLLLISSLVGVSAEEVSYEMQYSLVTPASNAYPDDGQKLTDGIFGTLPDGKSDFFSNGAYVGFNRASLDANGNFVVILDLGEVKNGLSDFTVGYLNEPKFGIYAPKEVSFAISDERNGSYWHIASLSTSVDENTRSMSKTLSDMNASGRFVRVTITPESTVKNANWTFIDEISVHSVDAIDVDTVIGDKINEGVSDIGDGFSTTISDVQDGISEGMDDVSDFVESLKPDDMFTESDMFLSSETIEESDMIIESESITESDMFESDITDDSEGVVTESNIPEIDESDDISIDESLDESIENSDIIDESATGSDITIDPDENNKPQTGDSSSTLGFIFLGVSALAMAFALFSRKNEF